MDRINKNMLGPDLLGKLPPQAVDLEEAVLGAILLEKDALYIVIDKLKPDAFYKDAHKEIYKAIIELFNNSKPVDLLTVTDQLRKNGKLEICGGVYGVSELTAKVSSAANIEYHATIIIEKSIKRQLINAASKIHRGAYDDTVDTFELLSKSENEIFQVGRFSEKKETKAISALSTGFSNDILSLSKKENKMTGIPSGFLTIDGKTNGFQGSDLIIIAARTSMGKTSLMLCIAKNAAVQFKIPTVIFSLEMPNKKVLNRLYSIESEIDSTKISRGDLTPQEWDVLGKAIDRLDNAHLYLDDTSGLSVLELRSKVKRLVANHGKVLVAIDYMQLMTSGMNINNREQEISFISRTLKSIAKEMDIPIIALSQLSRAVENRGDKTPQLSDLRESGSIEMDSDIVMFLYRPEYYKIYTDADGNSLRGIAFIDFAKNRDGGLGRKKIKFIDRLTKFQDFDYPKEEINNQSKIEFNSEKPPY